MRLKQMFYLNRRGVTLAEVIIATGISVLGFTVFFSGLNSVMTVKSKIDSFRGLQNFQDELIGHLNSPPAWGQTINDINNAALSCLRTGTDCSGQGGSFVVRNQKGDIFYDPDTQGLNRDGTVCASPGVGTCTYKIDVRWTPVCGTSGCVKPIVQFQTTIVQLSSQSPDSNSIGLLNARVNQNFAGNSLRSACEAINGSFDPLTGECAMALGGECPNSPVQQVVTGITSTMMKICKPIYHSAQCGSDFYFSGIRTDGSPYCIPKECCVVDFCSGLDLYRRQADCSNVLIQANTGACGGAPAPPPPTTTDGTSDGSDGGAPPPPPPTDGSDGGAPPPPPTTSSDGTASDGTSSDGTSSDGTSSDGGGAPPPPPPTGASDGTSSDGTASDGTSGAPPPPPTFTKPDGSSDGSVDGTTPDGAPVDGSSGPPPPPPPPPPTADPYMPIDGGGGDGGGDGCGGGDGGDGCGDGGGGDGGE